ncbi:MAG TPA: hypothetical protein VIN08_23960 [Ohtaekwangia sp.]|uniref:hypothetical protein n=1 Tax=Ohtaekwangia sp. TaxID=2066019 RepID=UPI002F959519
MRKTFLIATISLLAITVQAQQKRDTVIVELGKTSRVIFTIGDRKDLEVLKNYNYNDLFKNIITKLENNDTTALAQRDTTRKQGDSEEVYWTREGDDKNHIGGDDNGRDWNVDITPSRRWGRTWQSFNFDLGTNNYLENGKFPSSNANYSVRPWGSWYVGLSSIQRSRLGKNFFLEWGLGMSWYNFKFENDNTFIQKDDNGIQFIQDTRDYHYIKSKLTASYITASLIPIIDFGDNSRKARMWEGDGDSFRIGIGPYIGYRVGSHSKMVYKDDGDREKEKNRDSFYLNNFRYGARLQIGYRSTDLFFNYDINELFEAGKGPKLNAFSFGVIF